MATAALRLLDVVLLLPADSLHISALNTDACSIHTILLTCTLILSTAYINILSTGTVAVMIINSSLDQSVAVIAGIIC